MYFFGKQLEVLDGGVAEKAGVPEYREPLFFGRECRDKVTGVVGMCVGRVVWLFNSDQYILEIQPEDPAKESRIVWLDEGRIELTKEQEKSVEPEEIRGPRPGGVMDMSEYPERMPSRWAMAAEDRVRTVPY